LSRMAERFLSMLARRGTLAWYMEIDTMAPAKALT
jgi:hypothetical protein